MGMERWEKMEFLRFLEIFVMKEWKIKRLR
jgi:hypothetical protein